MPLDYDSSSFGSVADSTRVHNLIKAVAHHFYTVLVEDEVRIHSVHGSTCADLTGYPAEDFEGDTSLWAAIVFEKDRDVFLDSCRLRLSGNSEEPVEYRILHSSGELRWIRDTPIVYRKDDGRIVGFDGVVSDITDRKQGEDVARQALRQAENDLQAKSEFLTNMSHELRTPLNGIIGMADALMRTPLSDAQEHQVDIIRSSSQKLIDHISDTLELARIEAGVLKVVSRPFDLEAEVVELCSLLIPHAEEKGLDLLLKVSPDFPQEVIGDTSKIRQVIVNLVGNAIKFTSQGYVRVMLEHIPDWEEDRGAIVIRVEDSGAGMTSSSMELIFERFSQGEDCYSSKVRGSGLGLSIVKSFVEEMGGEVLVDSTIGKGTCFTVTIPAETSGPPLAMDIPMYRVLAVSGSYFTAGSISQQLDYCGFPHAVVTDTKAALKALESAMSGMSPYEALIIDSEHSGFEGKDLVEKVRADSTYDKLRILILTSLQAPPSLELLQQHSISVCITRPFSRAILCLALSTLSDMEDGDNPIISIGSKEPVFSGEADGLSQTGFKVLLADDNPVNREVAEQLLLDCGCEVTTIDNGMKAVESAAREAYDFILMDCDMPVTNGFEASHMIRRNEGEKHTPIIALTAHAGSEERLRCLEAGMDDFVTKPFSLEALQGILRRFSINISLVANKDHLKILVADDEKAIRSMLRFMLTALLKDPDIRYVADGQAACEELDRFIPDLVMTDIQMPILDGHEIIAKLKREERFKDVKTVVITAFDCSADLEFEGSSDKADLHIHKPFEVKSIQLALKRLFPETTVASVESARQRSDSAGSVGEEDILVFDLCVVEHSVRGNRDAVRSIIRSVQTSLPEHRDALKKHLQDGAWTELSRTAHAIKGTAATCGGLRLKESAGKLEQVLRDGNTGKGREMVPDLLNEVAEFLAALEETISNDLYPL